MDYNKSRRLFILNYKKLSQFRRGVLGFPVITWFTDPLGEMSTGSCPIFLLSQYKVWCLISKVLGVSYARYLAGGLGDKLRVFFLSSNSCVSFMIPLKPHFLHQVFNHPNMWRFLLCIPILSPIPFIYYVSFTALMVIYCYVCALSALLESKHFKGRNCILFARHLLLRLINVLTITGRHKKKHISIL